MAYGVDLFPWNSYDTCMIPAHVSRGIAVQDEQLRAMGPGGRLRIAKHLFDTARLLKKAGLKLNHPEWSSQRLEQETSRLIAHIDEEEISRWCLDLGVSPEWEKAKGYSPPAG